MARARDRVRTDRNRYLLREGFAVREGDTMVYGPDFIHRSHEEAFKIKHMLEEQSEIEEEETRRKSKRNTESRVAKLREAAEARGLDPDEVEREYASKRDGDGNTGD